ncbi:uncharacterized protein AAEQ78_001476 [Lycaon pictus]
MSYYYGNYYGGLGYGLGGLGCGYGCGYGAGYGGFGYGFYRPCCYGRQSLGRWQHSHLGNTPSYQTKSSAPDTMSYYCGNYYSGLGCGCRGLGYGYGLGYGCGCGGFRGLGCGWGGYRYGCCQPSCYGGFSSFY